MKSKTYVFENKNLMKRAEENFQVSAGFNLSSSKLEETYNRVKELSHNWSNVKCKIKKYDKLEIMDIFSDKSNTITVGKENISANIFSQININDINAIYFYGITLEENINPNENKRNSSHSDEIYTDLWGTAILDSGREVLRQLLLDDMQKNMVESKRDKEVVNYILSDSFAPGFYGIPLENMKQLYNILDMGNLDVTINESGVMSPSKTVAGIYMEVKKEGYQLSNECANCIGNTKACKFCGVYLKKMKSGSKAKTLQFNDKKLFTPNEYSDFANQGENEKINYGVAFDIGTTTVLGMLWDLDRKELLRTSTRVNPQVIYGADVISRISFASESQNNFNEIRRHIIECLNEIIDEFVGDEEKGENLSGKSQKSGMNFNLKSQNNGKKPNEKIENLSKVKEISIVGNPTMNHIVAGENVKTLAISPYAPAFVGGINTTGENLGFNTKEAKVYILPNLAGHVGSDITAGILATNIVNEDKTLIQIDIGTNGEICLAVGGKVLVASAAAGPAFEGGGISFGMSATEGAIDKVIINENSTVEIHTIEDKTPKGICGSGIIDAVSQLVKRKIVDTSGRMDCEEFALCKDDKGNNISISQKDIRKIQLTKGAIYAGIKILMKEMNLSDKDIDQIKIAGTFGSYIDIESAINIGLIPNIEKEKIVVVGNVAGEGASMVLLFENKRREIEKICNKIEHVELANHKEFQKEFLKAMEFPTSTAF